LGLLVSESPGFGSIPEDRLASTLKEEYRLLREGDYELAINRIEDQALINGYKSQDRFDILRLQIILNLLLSRYEKAEYYTSLAFSEAQTTGRKDDIPDFSEQLLLIKDIGQALNLRNAGDITKSNAIFEMAYHLASKSNNKVYILKIASLWSINFVSASYLSDKYFDLNNEAFRLAISLGYRLEACRAATKLGAFFLSKNKYSFALGYFLSGLQFIGGKPQSVDKARLLNNIAYIFLSFGDYDKAYDYYSEVEGLLSKLDFNPLRESALLNLGNLCLEQARHLRSADFYERAKRCFLEYVSSYPSSPPDNLIAEAKAGLANVLIDQGRITEAEAVLEPLLSFITKPELALSTKGTILLLKANLTLKRSSIHEAQQTYQKVLAIATRGNIPLLLIDAYCGLGRCAMANNDNSRAIELFNSSIGILSELYTNIANDSNRATFFNRYLDPFDSLINLYINLPTEHGSELLDRESFRISEFFRARSILEVRKRIVGNEAWTAESKIALDVDRLNRQRLDHLKLLAKPALPAAQITAINNDIRRIDDTLDESLFESFNKDTAAGFVLPVTVEYLQRALLTDHSAVIEYYLGLKGSVIYLITKDSFRIFRLPPSDAIADTVEGYLRFLRDPGFRLENGLPAAARLYKLLLAPAIESLSTAIDQLIIVPDGILFNLPFESLVSGSSERSGITYVNDSYMVSYAPSASSLCWPQSRSKLQYPKDIFAVGIWAYPSDDDPNSNVGLRTAGSILNELYKRSGFRLGPIPYVREELNNLKRRYPSSKSDYLLEEKATETAVKNANLADYRVIHLACHALSDDSYPLRSALVLVPSSEGNDDGFLQLSELYDLKTNADLVVLSACDTNSGKVTPNEGLLGMPRIFLYTGAHSTISTLWSVHDRASAQLMDFFYENYQIGLGKAKSLQVAKQMMYRSSYPHPYYWASYILTGEY
jgi:CHAT domain-containing protein